MPNEKDKRFEEDPLRDSFPWWRRWFFDFATPSKGAASEPTALKRSKQSGVLPSILSTVVLFFKWLFGKGPSRTHRNHESDLQSRPQPSPSVERMPVEVVSVPELKPTLLITVLSGQVEKRRGVDYAPHLEAFLKRYDVQDRERIACGRQLNDYRGNLDKLRERCVTQALRADDFVSELYKIVVAYVAGSRAATDTHKKRYVNVLLASFGRKKSHMDMGCVNPLDLVSGRIVELVRGGRAGHVYQLMMEVRQGFEDAVREQYASVSAQTFRDSFLDGLEVDGPDTHSQIIMRLLCHQLDDVAGLKGLLPACQAFIDHCHLNWKSVQSECAAEYEAFKAKYAEAVQLVAKMDYERPRDESVNNYVERCGSLLAAVETKKSEKGETYEGLKALFEETIQQIAHDAEDFKRHFDEDDFRHRIQAVADKYSDLVKKYWLQSIHTRARKCMLAYQRERIHIVIGILREVWDEVNHSVTSGDERDLSGLCGRLWSGVETEASNLTRLARQIRFRVHPDKLPRLQREDSAEQGLLKGVWQDLDSLLLESEALDREWGWLLNREAFDNMIQHLWEAYQAGIQDETKRASEEMKQESVPKQGWRRWFGGGREEDAAFKKDLRAALAKYRSDCIVELPVQQFEDELDHIQRCYQAWFKVKLDGDDSMRLSMSPACLFSGTKIPHQRLSCSEEARSESAYAFAHPTPSLVTIN